VETKAPKFARTKGSDSEVPSECTALVFYPDGSNELWLPLGPDDDDEVPLGAQIAVAIATELETDPSFVQGLVDKLRARIDQHVEETDGTQRLQ